MSVLVVAHAHPEESPGGGEVHAYESYLALAELTGGRAAFLFPSDAARGVERFRGRETELCFPFASEETAYDIFDDSRRLGPRLRRALAAAVGELRPDVVHLHHLYRVGREVVDLVRTCAPSATTVLTLHDLKSICPAGYMVRPGSRHATAAEALCDRASLERCGECCPSRSRPALAARERALRSSLRGLDLLVAPSRFLRDRYVAWGLDPARVVVCDYGRAAPAGAPRAIAPPSATDTRFGFFGRAIPQKGLGVLLDAIRLLGEERAPGARFAIHTPRPDPELAAGLPAGRVRLAGAYAPAEAAARMASVHWVVLPSVWWENSPLVVKEAAHARRPVIASDIGGMAENVREGVDGLHFRVGDAASLAALLERVTGDGPLWRRLARAAPVPMTPREHAERMLALYGELRARRGAA